VEDRGLRYPAMTLFLNGKADVLRLSASNPGILQTFNNFIMLSTKSNAVAGLYKKLCVFKEND